MKEVGNVEAIVDAINKNKDGSFFFVPWIGKEYEQGLLGKKVLVVGASHYCNHTNICFCPHDNSDCKYLKSDSCQKGCEHFQDCTSYDESCCGNTKLYDDDCKWMKRDEEHSCLYEKLCILLKNKNGPDIINKLSSTTLDEVCNFLDPNSYDNKSFKAFTKYCASYFDELPKDDPKIALWERMAFVNYAQNFQPSSIGNRFKKSDFKSFRRYIEILAPDVVIIWGCDLKHELENRLIPKISHNGYIWKSDNESCLDGKICLNSYHPSYSRFADGDLLDKAMDVVFKGKGNNEKDERK